MVVSYFFNVKGVIRLLFDFFAKGLYNLLGSIYASPKETEERKVIVMNEENDIFDVCDFILFYEDSKGRSVSNLRLQKLLYFIQAKFLKETNSPCFTEEMRAWKYGPVIPTIYQKYRGYGALSIEVSHFPYSVEARNRLNGWEFIEEILEQMREISTGDLVDITHCQKPWNEARKMDGEITIQMMRDTFGAR